MNEERQCGTCKWWRGTNCLKCGKPRCGVLLMGQRHIGKRTVQLLAAEDPSLCHGGESCVPLDADADATPVHYHTFAGSMDRCERTDCDPAPTGGTALVTHRICDDCCKPIAMDADAYCAGHGEGGGE